MPITIHCPHCKNVELKLQEDKRTPEGLLECPKCHCTFRVCLGIFDGKCYVRMNPDHGKLREIEKQKKRGRPKKVEENVPD